MWNLVKCSPLAATVLGLFASLLLPGYYQNPVNSSITYSETWRKRYHSAWLFLPHFICVGLISFLWLSWAVPFPALGLLSHFHWLPTFIHDSLRNDSSLPEGCISNWKLHVFLILKGIQCTENPLFPPLETQQHLISPPAPSLLRWGLQSKQLFLRAQYPSGGPGSSSLRAWALTFYIFIIWPWHLPVLKNQVLRKLAPWLGNVSEGTDGWRVTRHALSPSGVM